MNSYIDYTNVKIDATKEDIKKLCEEAKDNHFASVCINPCYVEFAKTLLQDSTVSVCTVVGFPLGASTTMTKSYEAIAAIEAGADEIDMVINVGALKDKDYEYVKNEIEEIRDSIDGHTLKVIIETRYLTKEEIIKVVEICNETFVHFINTSTGFESKEANVEDIDLIKQYKSEVVEIKVNADYKNDQEVSIYLEKGASRIGTSYENRKGE